MNRRSRPGGWWGLRRAREGAKTVGVRPKAPEPAGAESSGGLAEGRERLAALLAGRLASLEAAEACAEHGRLADRFLRAWGGLDAGLPRLRAEPELADVEGARGLTHVVAHLIDAGRFDDVHRLLACEGPAGGARLGVVNVWFDAHQRSGRLEAYREHLASARRLAERATDDALAAGRPAPSLGRELRYALLADCAARAARTLPDELARALLAAGVWCARRALSNARRHAGPAKRARALVALLPSLPARERQAALDEALAAAAELWAAPESDESACRDVLEGLAPHLDEGALRRLLNAALALEHEYARARLFVELAPHLPVSLAREALPAIGLLEGYEQAQVLAALADRLEGEALREALALAKALPEPSLRAQALGALAARLPPEARAPALDVAVAAAREAGQQGRAGPALAALLPLLPAAQRAPVQAEALATLRSLEAGPLRVDELIAIAALAPDEERRGLLREALSTATGSDHAADLLERVVPALPDAMLDEALGAARALAGAGSTRALRALAARVPADRRHALQDEVLRIELEAVGYESYFSGVLLDLAPHLPPDLTAHALGAVREAGSVGYLGRMLTYLAPRLPDESLGPALAAARGLTRADHRANALAAISDRLPPGERAALLAEALAAARASDGGARTSSLFAVARRLPLDAQAPVLAEALFWSGFDTWDTPAPDAEAELAPLRAGAAGAAPFALLPVPDRGHDRSSLDSTALVVRAQRARRRGASPAAVVGLLRQALRGYSRRFVGCSGRALGAAALDLGGAEALGEYLAAVRDSYRWWPA